MPQPNGEYVRELLEAINSSPYPVHIGMRITSVTPDRATAELRAERCHLQPFDMVHGGVLATLIDTATFWAAFMRLPEDCGLVNVDLKLNYLKPAVSGLLTAEGHCLRAGRTISYAVADVKDEAGELVAHGTSTLMALPGKGIRLKARKFVD